MSRTIARLTWCKSANQYKKQIGQCRTVTGKKRWQRFYLGKDLVEARKKALTIEAKRKAEELRGYDYWTEAVLDELSDAGLIQSRHKHRKLKMGDQLPDMAKLTVAVVKADPTVALWMNEDGSVKPEHFLDFNKHALTLLIGQEQQTQILLDRVNELWHDDPLTCLERISKLNLAPTQFNLAIGAHVVPLAFDASNDDLPPIQGKINE